MWPHDDTESLIEFYGKPWEDTSLLTHVAPPFAMYYEGTQIHGILIHVKCADSLLAALNTAWDAYGRDQAQVDEAGLSNYSGSYNYRSVRGSDRLSCHAFGAAIDIDAEQNPMNYNGDLGAIPAIVVNAFKAQGWFWGGDYKSGRLDPMHLQAAAE